MLGPFNLRAQRDQRCLYALRLVDTLPARAVGQGPFFYPRRTSTRRDWHQAAKYTVGMAADGGNVPRRPYRVVDACVLARKFETLIYLFVISPCTFTLVPRFAGTRVRVVRA